MISIAGPNKKTGQYCTCLQQTHTCVLLHVKKRALPFIPWRIPWLFIDMRQLLIKVQKKLDHSSFENIFC